MTHIYLTLSQSVADFYPALEKGEVKPGTVVVFRYQGPKGAPGMPEMLGNLYSHFLYSSA